MRSLSLFAVLSVAGCVALQSPEDYDRPVSEQTVDGVRVTGPFSTTDADSILSAVRARTSDRVMSVSVPHGVMVSYRRHEIDGLPSDTAEVWTYSSRPGLHGYGGVYYLSRRAGVWAVRDTSGWIE